MHKQVTFIVALIAIAVSTPAQAQLRGWLSSNGDSVVVEQPFQTSTPIQSTHIGGDFKHGYPFRSGCCEGKTSCCQGLWDGYCSGHCHKGHSKGCGTSCQLSKGKGHGCAVSGRLHFGGCGHKGGFGCGHSTCGKGGCSKVGGYGKGGYAHVGKGGWAVSSKGGCGACGHHGCGGACGCGSCGHGSVGLFDWLNFGHGKGCGCHSCSGGKGHTGFSKGHGKSGKGCSSCGGSAVHGWPAQTHGHTHQLHDAPIQMHSAPALNEAPAPTPIPTPALDAPIPPPVHIEATPTSDHSAQLRRLPYGGRFMYSGF